MPRTAAGHGWRPAAVTLIVTFFVVVALLATHSADTALGYSEFSRIALAPNESQLTGLQVVDGALAVGDEPLRRSGLADGAPAGLAEWQPVPQPEGADAVQVYLDAVGTVEVDLRSSQDGVAWSSWAPVAPGGTLATRGAQLVQARAMVADQVNRKTRLYAMQLQFLLAQGGGEQVAATAPQATPENPTIRLWATREGLVGGRTANGHRIVERDHF